MRNTFGVLAVSGLLSVSVQAQNLMITGILDGPLTGGAPKFMELYAINDIPNLSLYAIGLAANGAASFSAMTSDNILPNISLSAGSFYYVVGNQFDDMTDAFDLVYPGYTAIRDLNFGVNSNGDDTQGLFFDATGAFSGGQTLIDVFGVVGQDGTGQPWEHLDGWAYSDNGRTPSTTFNLSDWTFSGNDVLDPFSSDPAGVAAAFPDQTFVVPEPSTAVLACVGGLLLVSRLRRRK
jgi:hypothetical protein